MIRKIFIISIFTFSLFSSSQELLILKKKYKRQAIYHRDRAECLQFNRKDIKEAKKHWILYKNYMDVLNKIDEEIKAKYPSEDG